MFVYQNEAFNYFAYIYQTSDLIYYRVGNKFQLLEERKRKLRKSSKNSGNTLNGTMMSVMWVYTSFYKLSNLYEMSPHQNKLNVGTWKR